MQQVKYRLVNPRLAPRRTKLEMPGWAGQPEPRADGSQEFAWHCAPFTEGAQYGIESSLRMTTSFTSAGKAASLFLMAISDRAHTIAAI